jgi:hypothetical protein
MNPDDIDTDLIEVRHLIETTGVSETEAWRILDTRAAAREAAARGRAEGCIKCGRPLTDDDPVVTTLGPRCRRCF